MRMAAVTGIAVAFVALLASPIIADGPVGTGMDSAAAGLKHMLGR
jgi:hypothetical protein